MNGSSVILHYKPKVYPAKFLHVALVCPSLIQSACFYKLMTGIADLSHQSSQPYVASLSTNRVYDTLTKMISFVRNIMHQ